MTFGSRTFGSNTFGGRRPVYMYNGDESGDTNFQYEITVNEHLNIKYRKIVTYLWSRQAKISAHSFLLANVGDYLLHSEDGRFYISDNTFNRVGRNYSTWSKINRKS
jgi:hypothetical protein